MCLMSVMTPMEFSLAEHSADHSTLFRRNIQNLYYLYAVVDTRTGSLAGARNHREGVYLSCGMCSNSVPGQPSHLHVLPLDR
jgi:hypothetical protein